MPAEEIKLVVPWHCSEQLEEFMKAWKVAYDDQRIVFQQDADRSGCAPTKNAGIVRALNLGADIVVILDDDCFPQADEIDESDPLARFFDAHVQQLQPQPVSMFSVVTDPPSRGTPYHSLTITMEVAASMGFWAEVGDYDAPRQLVYGCQKAMTFRRQPIYGTMFPLCGMNLAFRPKVWLPWCQFIDVPRFDDIWMGWLWQKEAYRHGYCFNLNGPLIRHRRQSNVWKNLGEEARYLERNESLWAEIVTSKECDYDALRKLLPC